MKKVEKTPYEFYLYINEHIICQRYFQVRKFNNDSLRSYELKEMIDSITAFIEEDFKSKTVDYLYSYYNEYAIQLEEEIDRKDIYENEDFFDVEVRVEGKIVAKRRFSGNVYPPKVRYSVNIKELIPEIISRIQESLEQKNYTTTYGEVQL